MRSKRNTKKLVYFFICLVLVAGVILALQIWDGDSSDSPRGSKTPSYPMGRTVTPKATVQTSVPTPRPNAESVDLNVPFYSQAPSGDWSMPWQEACEEASMILVSAYISHEQLTTEIVEQRILEAVKWEQEHFGFYEHTTAKQTADMIRALYGFKNVSVEYDIGIERIEEHLRAGRPLIVPMAGRLLGNPYYTWPGPVYHMLVIRGIASNGDIITNDVGTRHGNGFLYDQEVFLSAMHDAPTGGNSRLESAADEQWVESGRRAIIVIYPN